MRCELWLGERGNDLPSAKLQTSLASIQHMLTNFRLKLGSQARGDEATYHSKSASRQYAGMGTGAPRDGSYRRVLTPAFTRLPGCRCLP